MKIYRLARVDDPKSFLHVGMLFFKWQGVMYPLGATNGVGLDLKFLGLDNQEKFDEYFDKSTDKPISEIPALCKYVDRLSDEIAASEVEINEKRDAIRQILAEDSSLERKHDCI